MDGTVVVVEVKFLVRAFVSLETLQSIRSSLVEAKALLESRKHVGGFLAVIVFVVGDRTGSLHRVMTKASDVFARSLQPTEFSVVVEDLSRLEALAVGDSSGESEPK
jgi:hypothetical protein